MPNFSEISYPCPSCLSKNTASVITGRVTCLCGYQKLTCHIDGHPADFVKPSFKARFRKVEDFGSRENRIKGAWKSEIARGRHSIYISCGCCGGINDLSDARVLGGYCECFHCGWCSVDHISVALNGFQEYEDVPRKEMTKGLYLRKGLVQSL